MSEQKLPKKSNLHDVMHDGFLLFSEQLNGLKNEVQDIKTKIDVLLESNNIKS